MNENKKLIEILKERELLTEGEVHARNELLELAFKMRCGNYPIPVDRLPDAINEVIDYFERQLGGDLIERIREEGLDID